MKYNNRLVCVMLYCVLCITHVSSMHHDDTPPSPTASDLLRLSINRQKHLKTYFFFCLSRSNTIPRHRLPYVLDLIFHNPKMLDKPVDLQDYGVGPYGFDDEDYAAMIERFLAEGISAQEINTLRETPLMWAAHAGSIRAVRLLLRHGADPCARDRLWRSASDFAIMARDKQSVQSPVFDIIIGIIGQAQQRIIEEAEQARNDGSPQW